MKKIATSLVISATYAMSAMASEDGCSNLINDNKKIELKKQNKTKQMININALKEEWGMNNNCTSEELSAILSKKSVNITIDNHINNIMKGYISNNIEKEKAFKDYVLGASEEDTVNVGELQGGEPQTITIDPYKSIKTLLVCHVACHGSRGWR